MKAVVPNRKWWKKGERTGGAPQYRSLHCHETQGLDLLFPGVADVRTHEERLIDFTDYQIDFLSAINHNLLKASEYWCSAIPDNKILLDTLESYVLLGL